MFKVFAEPEAYPKHLIINRILNGMKHEVLSMRRSILDNSPRGARLVFKDLAEDLALVDQLLKELEDVKPY